VAEAHNSAHVISLFRFQMRDLTPAQRQEYSSTAERLLTLASAMPGYISFRHYPSDNHEMWVMLRPMPDKV
jgi:heme-degrading monooxygenase HmoA